MLTKDELEFLSSQGLVAADVFDARGMSATAWKAGVRQAGKALVLGSPCSAKGHRLRTRSGHCAQCDTSKLGYQKRHNSEGYVYIAGSQMGRILKIGTCVDIEQRRASLRNQRYANFGDWEILYSVKVDAGGRYEGKALALLTKYRASRAYAKDGKSQAAEELVKAGFSTVLASLEKALHGAKKSDVHKHLRWRDYEFSDSSPSVR